MTLKYSAADLDSLPDDDLPPAVGRLKRRKKESADAWRARARDHLMDMARRLAVKTAKDAEKLRKKRSRLSKRSPDAILTVCSLFGVRADVPVQSAEDGHNISEDGTAAPSPISQAEFLASLMDADVPVVAIDMQGAAPSIYLSPTDVLNDVDGLRETRLRMTGWISDTLETRQNEAMCDLDCLHCPRHQLLGCRLTNGSLLPSPSGTT